MRGFCRRSRQTGGRFLRPGFQRALHLRIDGLQLLTLGLRIPELFQNLLSFLLHRLSLFLQRLLSLLVNLFALQDVLFLLLHEVLQIVSNRDFELDRTFEVVDLPLLVLDDFILLVELTFHLLLEFFVFFGPVMKLLLEVTGLNLFFGQLSDRELELLLKFIVELQLLAVLLVGDADLL